MAETIESFVNKLQIEGVQAGEKAAEDLKADAAKEADSIIADAKSEAGKITDAASREAEDMITRAKSELDLAVRDTVLRLHEILNKSLQGILSQASESALKDTDFLKTIISDLVKQYCVNESGIKINVTPENYQQLSKWVFSELSQADDGNRINIGLSRELEQAGFEFTVTDGTIEITKESVSAVLAELVGPGLKKLLSD